jgi:Protein of unknown function (DUF3887)
MANRSTPGRQCAYCGRTLPFQEGRGRVRQFCDATCRSAARRARQAAAGPSAVHVNKNLTPDSREGKLDNVRNTAPSGDPAVVTRVLDAARAAMDDVPEDAAMASLEAVTVIRSLARVVEDGLREAVALARQSGHTWAEIGDLLGTSRQAAFQRFGRPLDPRTGAPMSASILPGATGRAAALFADLAEQRWEQACADFSPAVAAKLDASGLAAVWAQVIGLAGAYQSMGEPVTHQAGDYTVVDVPLFFEAAAQTGRISYTQDGQVAGLFFLADRS